MSKFISLERTESCPATAEPIQDSPKKMKYFPTFYLDSTQMQLPDNMVGKEFQAEVKLYIKSKRFSERTNEKGKEKEYNYDIEVRSMKVMPKAGKNKGMQQTIEDELENEMKKES